VVLGGTADDTRADRQPDDEVAARILQRCVAIEPRLAGLPVLEHRVGLRPARARVRLEREGTVVHNYGHGGAGVSISWGCAREVTRAVSAPA
jgi:D-amino-acid oxidase